MTHHFNILPLKQLTASLQKRHGGVLLFFLVFLGFAFATRVALLLKAAPVVSWDLSLPAAFGWGILYDIGAACWFSLPLIVLLTILPERFFERRWGRLATHLVAFSLTFILLFTLAAEWVFWDEFGVRFNFIAVDYLVYTHEVIDNIIESYPMPLLLSFIGVLSLAFHIIFWKTGLPGRWLSAASQKSGPRYRTGIAWCMGVVFAGLIINQNWLPDFANNYNRELGKNGIWSFFAAFRNNELEYKHFFPTIPDDQAFQRMKTEVEEDGSVLLRPEARDMLRFYSHEGPELKPNVIQITVESLSYEFLYKRKYQNLTPNLSALESKSLVFDNFYATGTRTDRGMEALTLSLPPTPGRSLVKRPHNEGLFTLGSLFRAKGYDTAFIYSGYGYFDNMNHFFGNNGYRVIDRSSVNRNDITFANVWGACDEDLYRWTLREADRMYKSKNKPFHFFVMTTSNHRPFTFPDGRIDLPSKSSGRRGGVKYSDYAIGQFLREAAKKPWFKNTIFVIVADHCASSAGKTELPVDRYHIPLIIYAPGGQLPTGHVQMVASQMDFAPTLLGLLNWSYPSRFLGHDIFSIDPQEGHAIIGNYQELGHIEEGKFAILKPLRKTVSYRYDFIARSITTAANEKDSLKETISYYQVASYLYKHGLYRALTPLEFDKYMEQGRSLIKRKFLSLNNKLHTML
ncbi:MAG: Lipoteichoic acid synthase 2 [Syntrophus sp. PtaB.Bin001]|nr:MAG: Lipoteichoic acid synthase 2 [Syntrophus sp. PtaB.Bin001]